MSSRRGFLRQVGAGAVAAAAVPIVGSSLVSPVSRVPVGVNGFAAILGAVKDVYSSEIWLSAFPIMRFDQFATKRSLIPRFNKLRRAEEEEIENIANRIRLRAGLKKRRSFFDFGRLFEAR